MTNKMGEVMYTYPMTMVMGMPDSGMLFGGTAPQSILNRLNAPYEGDSGINTFFGSVGDSLASAYQHFNNVFTNTANKTLEILDKAKVLISNKNKMEYICNEDDLYTVPPCMYTPILTYQPIREWASKGVTCAWGVDVDELPEGDPYENQTMLGLFETDHESKMPEMVEWVWSTEDEMLPFEERNILLESRRFMELFILKEQNEGTLRDPCGFSDGLLLGELR